MTPHAWITERRVGRARHLLRGAMPIAQVAFACGFSSQSHLTRAFRKLAGRTPAEYRALARAGM
ncbi:helix-turn-helix transcriptional regulator [Paracoccus sp. CPCC 101403]|uniref:Helix-turn-helix transcriptional regulator n=2 Tax=Paracoccus broussonetiae TaxID=3075834 RepID=A0ABU3EEF0_9RHOB|nr:helix-turn-helix transcriptional regulator [Paracoccus sp. CPCC 101403]